MKFSLLSPFKKKDAGGAKGTAKARTNGRTAKKHAKSAPMAQHPFRAVAVYSRDLSLCEAAKRLDGHKFLAAHAPELPLGGCSQPGRCTCRYRHYQDRRQDVRRDEDYGLQTRHFVANERRSRGDRRKSSKQH